MIHEGYLSSVLMLIAQLSKPVTLTFASAVSDQIETTTDNQFRQASSMCFWPHRYETYSEVEMGHFYYDQDKSAITALNALSIFKNGRKVIEFSIN
jgi:hypothetical protein